MKKYAAFMLFCAISAHAEDTFDTKTNVLKIESVIVDNIRYSNVSIRLKDLDILSVESANPVTENNSEIKAACSSANFTLDKYNSIQINMTLNDVNKTIGCVNDDNLTTRIQNLVTEYGWSTQDSLKMIMVHFDPTGTYVRGISGTTSFKTASGF